MVRSRKVVCAACRQRKSKCDGALPRCSSCMTAKSVCKYDKAPSLAYVRELQQRIQQLERASQTQPAPADAPAFRGALSNDEHRVPISLDASGDVRYHNSLSAIHEALPEGPSGNLPVIDSHLAEAELVQSERQSEEAKLFLRNNAATQREFEASKLEKIASHAGISATLAKFLLQLHWCWLHPAFIFVYRPAFTREMSLLGSDQHQTNYCSITLLKVLLAHSCRFVRDAKGLSHHDETFQQLADRLMSETTLSLAMECLQPPSIATVQALVQISARDIASGQSSQAWLYSGMAFRMAIDLGIHISPEKLNQHAKALSYEDIEVRKRLFWGLYAWDKFISLYLGRMPNFLMGAENIPLDFLDDYTETEPWEPVFGPETESAHFPVFAFCAAHTVSCFTWLSKLCQVLSRLMLELYSPHPLSTGSTSTVDSKTLAFVGISKDLQDWWQNLPHSLRISPSEIPSSSPPPHIVSLNLIYHTTLILLHRPLLTNQPNFNSTPLLHSWKVCQSATSATFKLLKMYVGAFGFNYITYMNSYCTYTAATTTIYQLEKSQSQQRNSFEGFGTAAWDELKFFISVLQHTKSSMPVLNRSIDIIQARIKRILERQSAAYLSSLFTADPELTSPEVSRPDSSTSQSSNRAPTTPANPLLSSQQQQHAEQTTSVPTAWEIPNNTSYPIDTFEGGEWLPAFPAQDFLYGSDLTLEFQENLSPNTRSALLQSSLDPHMQLDLTTHVDGYFDPTHWT